MLKINLKELINPRLVVSFLMGISSGLPLLITITLMQAWAKESGISLRNIGLMTLVGLPYTLKFLWAPLFDRYTLPFLGRRKGWLLVIQLALILSVLAMGMSHPKSDITYFIITAALVAFFSASQDIVIDAFRREDLTDKELGLGSSYYIYGYRVGMLLTGWLGLRLAHDISWKAVFMLMASLLAVGMLTTLFAKEPKVVSEAPKNFTEAVLDPFIEFFKRSHALSFLAFILLYKFGDNLASSLTTPFYLELGFDKRQIADVTKGFGFWATLLGAFLGGVVQLKIGISRSLWIFGGLQMISTAGFAILSMMGNNLWGLAGVVAFENLSAGMGTAAYTAFMASITNKKFTATQYALLTSIMGIPRNIASSVTGYMVETMGWLHFFTFCTLIAIPGMLLLFKFAPWKTKD